MARRLGASAAQLEALSQGDDSTFSPAWRSALAFAAALTPAGARPDDATFDDLARHWSASQIVEITSVATLFNYFNRFALALDIPVTR